MLGLVRVGLDAPTLRAGQTAVGIHHGDALPVEIRVQLLHLLLGDLDLLQAGLDLREGQHPSLLSFGDQRTQLVKFDDRRLIAQQNDLVNAHSP